MSETLIRDHGSQAQISCAKNSQETTRPRWLEALIDEIAAKHDVNRHLMMTSRRRRYVTAKDELVVRLRARQTVDGKPMSFPRIGALLGQDHATIIIALRRAQSR